MLFSLHFFLIVVAVLASLHASLKVHNSLMVRLVFSQITGVCVRRGDRGGPGRLAKSTPHPQGCRGISGGLVTMAKTHDLRQVEGLTLPMIRYQIDDSPIFPWTWIPSIYLHV